MQTLEKPVELGVLFDLVTAAKSNDAFRRVLETGDHEQVVAMTIPIGSDIGEEVHPNTDQILIIVEGLAEARLDGAPSLVHGFDVVFVKAGTRHNVINRGTHPLRLITIYGPPEHAPGTVHKTKAEAEAAEG